MEYLYFLPVSRAVIHPNEVKSFESNCFLENTILIEKLTKEETIILIKSNNKRKLICADNYIIANSHSHILKIISFKGDHRIKLKKLTDDDLINIKVNGFVIMSFCQTLLNSLGSIFKTIELFVGGNGMNPDSLDPRKRPTPPKYMEKATLDFLQDFMGYKMETRGEWSDKIIDIDTKYIKSGDFLAIHRTDGTEAVIMSGTGGKFGHCAMFMWIDGELHIIESRSTAYWNKKGVQRNKWSEWAPLAAKSKLNVAYLPLREEYRQKFDEKKALEFFYEIEGLPYGTHVFFFSVFDVPGGLDQPRLQMDMLPPIISLLELILPKAVDLYFNEALNFRLGTKGLKFNQAVIEAAKRNITIHELMAIPEQDEWVYSNGLNFICSSIVVAMWKAGGMFGDLVINAAEFTPRDVVQLDIFEKDFHMNRPQVCKDADPNLEYCQLFGKYRVDLYPYNFVKPYSHINERCPSNGPKYERPEGC